jgi:kynurenine formamidase
MNVKITHLSHAEGALEDQKYYDIDPNDWPFPGNAYADDFVEMTTHAGTHMDAPWHMGPQMKDGSKPLTIDEWPLEHCMGPGVVLDISNIPQGHEVSREEALKWILEQGVKVVGTDSWSFDRPYSQWAKDYHDHGRDPKYLWPCHLLGLELPYAHIEKMANLDQLPPHGFTVIAFPVKISQGTAGFCRAVALLDD